MSSLIELESSIPSLFKTYENENILFIAKIREESIYFFDQLTPRTTIVLLADPACYELKRFFIELVAEFGITVIDLQEQESFDPNYTMNNKSKTIITDLLTNYKYKRIITHPNYTLNDPQNKSLYNFINKIVKQTNSNNHYTYNLTNESKIICKKQMEIIKIYSYIVSKNRLIYENYINIASKINGLKKVENKYSK